jgi:biopolymer transport protein ExbD
MSNGGGHEPSLTSLMAKVRGRIRREIATAEEEEHEGGELNLVPYLDILVNTIIFLLATTASALALANINVNSPRYEESGAAASSTTPDQDEQKRLNLTVAVSYTGFIVAGAGGVMTAPDGTSPTIKCSVPLQKKRCPAFLATRTSGGETEKVWVDKYDYKALIRMMKDIKKKYPGERQVILSADRLIPYKVVVRTMDNLRGTPTKKCTGDDGCMFDQVILSAGVQ